VPAARYEAFRDELIAKLLAITDPASGERVVRRVLRKEEAFPGANNQQAPDLTVVMRDHGFLSIKNRAPHFEQRPAIDGTHYPEGVFLAAGPGIRRGASLPQLSILQVAPSLLYSLGLPIPEDFEASIAESAFEPAFLAQTPRVVGEPTLPPGFEPAAEEVAAASATRSEEDEQIYKQLKALGYIE
jgi:predicted AlkP superfamily phosphohydrolase/phosphomutase